MNTIHAFQTEAGTCGFTRTDLVVALAGAALLIATVLPLLAAADPQTNRASCLANLHEIGVAYRSWASDHGNRVPWAVPQAEGGSHDLPGGGAAWYQYLWISNHLSSPQFLACPSDTVRPATTWDRDRTTGLFHANQRANSVSYFLGLDVQLTSPNAFFGGDRNLQFSARGKSCDYAGVKTAACLIPGDAEVHWTPGGHGEANNILFYDGRAESLNNDALHTALGKTQAVHEENHCLPAR